jgi:hypothetical protein
MTERKSQGQAIDSRAIKKHKNDVFRLYQILDPRFTGEIPDTVKKDLRKFAVRMKTEVVDFKSLGLGTTDIGSVLADFRNIFRLD